MCKRILGWMLAAAALLGAGSVAAGGDAKTKAVVFRLDSLDGLEAVNAKPEIATHLGRRAVHIVNLHDASNAIGDESLAILGGSEFKDGTIEVDLAGMPRSGATEDTRGFVGIAFRVRDHGGRFDCFYLRMTNGRAEDQLRRNHSAQYISEPGFPWEKLRAENPGVYESYVDVEPGAWTKMKIAVEGAKARLYVNGAEQPCLLVNDLKQGENSGQVALWVGDQTEAYFSNLTVR